ncbi:nucleoside diphosphate kinase regulator [Solimicrobium silvestre]|uniref:Transcription elongation factor n=1 Tax=Solimicrobium silvestre TaxID=2099400 RepID=A0A2S9GTR5_9BURK|nr:nucleoside diphosphate kinase regulator [Solimicrobium silvestre]PRC91114.1 Transcription elongation factor [Solimicrobium silvestre]
MEVKPPIVVSSFDLERIEQLLESNTHRNLPGIDALLVELNRADIVSPEEIPDNVITMNSKARFIDDATAIEYDLTLVYPHQANLPDTVSIFAPVGSALLGMSVKQTIAWQVPSGRTMKLRILSIIYQPEAQGDFHL